MKITVNSLVSGKASGCLYLDVKPTTAVDSVIKHFCREKGIEHTETYFLCKENVILHKEGNLAQNEVTDGTILALVVSDTEAMKLMFYSWYKVAILTLLIGCGSLAYLTGLIFHGDSPSRSLDKFAIIIDAGSSHSESYLYTWKSGSPGQQLQVLCQCYTRDGISSFASHPEDLGSYLEACVSQLEKCVPDSEVRNTQVYVAATAGMRILRDINSTASDAILSILHNYFALNTSFAVKQEDIGIISGEREALCGWIALNMHQRDSATDSPAVAVIDLGGASLEFTYPLDGNSFSQSQFKQGQYYSEGLKLNSSSYLCYGLTEALNRFESLLLKEKYMSNSNVEVPLNRVDSVQETVIQNPCLPVGSELLLRESELKQPCALSAPVLIPLEESRMFKERMKQYQLKYVKTQFMSHNNSLKEDLEQHKIGEDRTKTYLFKGMSNADECEALMDLIFDEEVCRKTFIYGDCLGMRKIPLSAYSRVFALSQVFNMIMAVLQPSDSTFEGFYLAIRDLCNRPLASLKSQLQEFGDEIEGFCFDAMYVYKVLRVFSIDSHWDQFEPNLLIGNGTVEWTAGYLLNQTLSADQNPSKAFTLHFVFLGVLFSALVLVSLLLLLCISRTKHSYQRLLL